jgi:hypothetical protein
MHPQKVLSARMLRGLVLMSLMLSIARYIVSLARGVYYKNRGTPSLALENKIRDVDFLGSTSLNIRARIENLRIPLALRNLWTKWHIATHQHDAVRVNFRQWHAHCQVITIFIAHQQGEVHQREYGAKNASFNRYL